jgi:hypothetical protein
MAKKAQGRKRREPAVRTRVLSSPRVSTRRLPSNADKSQRRRAPASRERARAAAAPETLQVTLELRDVSDRLIRDPETFFTFRRVADRRQIGDQLVLELTGTPSVFELPVATGDIAVCEVDTKRFRFAHSPVFFRSPGGPISRRSQLLREPKEWTPRFTRWNDLPASFGDLKRVLAASPGVTLFKGVDPIADQLLVESAYDGMSSENVTLAKTALLNSHFRLKGSVEPVSNSRSWFSFVSRVIAIGQERFLAFVEPEMETVVRQIHAHIDEFRADYERTPSENHRGNVPAALQNRITSMISIKSTHSKGNFQLTLTHLSGPDEVLLDTDIDENGELLGHVADLFKHKITGGTHPHDIHEILVLQDGKAPGFDLGYRLT